MRYFLEGVGSLFDIFPEPPENPIKNKPDSQRMKSDWEKIGKDMYKAMESLTNGRESKSKRNNK